MPDPRRIRWLTPMLVAVLAAGACSSTSVASADLPLTGSRLGPERVTQDAIASGSLSLDEIRAFGLEVFATPFTTDDGYGDGPLNRRDLISPGGRPTLQGNGTFLRVNGLDGQTCLECHSIVSAATVPATFGVGGVGGSVSNAIFQPTAIDVCDAEGTGMAGFDGRFINPPFLFGSGGVEALAAEMTADLRALRQDAEANPGTEVHLITKGVDFGIIVVRDGEIDTSGVEGVDPDLVVRPFGRKGEFPTVRAFDVEAMPFHFGMQPVEKVGAGVDADGDGIDDEITIGEISALHIFNTTLRRPEREDTAEFDAGLTQLEALGCTVCHRPELTTESRYLSYTYPEGPEDSDADWYFRIDLTGLPGFDEAPGGGVTVPLFADLKRHDMGDDLAESFGSELDRIFTTARLWGVADTAPYLHDGRATTLPAAILLHGGEAQDARDAFAALSEADRRLVVGFLASLRTPRDAMSGLEP